MYCEMIATHTSLSKHTSSFVMKDSNRDRYILMTCVDLMLFNNDKPGEDGRDGIGV